MMNFATLTRAHLHNSPSLKLDKLLHLFVERKTFFLTLHFFFSLFMFSFNNAEPICPRKERIILGFSAF